LSKDSKSGIALSNAEQLAAMTSAIEQEEQDKLL